jgi:hypothetical protein
MVTRWIERIDYDGAGGTVAITFHTHNGQSPEEDRAERVKKIVS